MLACTNTPVDVTNVRAGNAQRAAGKAQMAGRALGDADSWSYRDSQPAAARTIHPRRCGREGSYQMRNREVSGNG